MTAGRRVRLSAKDIFRDFDGEWIGQDELGHLGHSLAEAAAQIGPVLAVRRFADGLDLALGQRFAGMFTGRDFELSPHCPVPVRFSAVSIIQGALNGNPSKRTVRFDELERLRLAPEDLRGLSISASWSASEQLAPLAFKKTARFAAGVTNKTLDEFGLTRYRVADSPVFFDVKAKDPDQTKTIEAILSAAGSENVDVLVLPELCLTLNSVEHVRAWRQAVGGARIPLVIAGSVHLRNEQGEAGTNESLAFLGGKEVRHSKFRPFIFDDQLADDGETIMPEKVERTEHLKPATNRFTVHYSGDWSFVVLICKDALDLATQELVRALAVQLVLIPAMSESTHELHDLANLLAADPQAITVIANTGPVSAIFGSPRRTVPVIDAVADRKTIVIFDTSGHVVLRPCPALVAK
jgi:predicted amidohydrolase